MRDKKEKHASTKRALIESDAMLLRQKAKVDSMTKFCRIFIRHMKAQNVSLQEAVQSHQRETKEMFRRASDDFALTLCSRLQQVKQHYEQLLGQERQHADSLKAAIDATHSDSSKLLQTKHSEQVHSLEQQLAQMKEKNLKLKGKL